MLFRWCNNSHPLKVNFNHTVINWFQLCPNINSNHSLDFVGHGQMCVMDKVSLTKETSNTLKECFNKLFLPLSPSSGNLVSVIVSSSERPKYSSVECVHHSWNTACTDWMIVSLLWWESFLTTCLPIFSEENVLFSALDSLLSPFFQEGVFLLSSISHTENPAFKFSELLSFFKSWLSSVSLFS